MKPRTKQILVWTPRVLGIAFALFLSLFALDVFGVGYGFWGTLVALFMHLLPVFALLIAIGLAWRWEWIGALLFGGFGIWYVATHLTPSAMINDLIIAGPPIVIAILYLVDWLYRAELHPEPA